MFTSVIPTPICSSRTCTLSLDYHHLRRHVGSIITPRSMFIQCARAVKCRRCVCSRAPLGSMCAGLFCSTTPLPTPPRPPARVRDFTVKRRTGFRFHIVCEIHSESEMCETPDVNSKVPGGPPRHPPFPMLCEIHSLKRKEKKRQKTASVTYMRT